MTENELLEALYQALDKPVENNDPPGAMTRQELQESLGWSDKRILKELHRLNDEGRLESVMVSRETLTGIWRKIPAYRLMDGNVIQGPTDE